MATYAEIIKFDDTSPQHVIRLIKSGEFYRAYNHSAWLFQCCIAEHKVMRKYVKALDREIFYIGFPEKSLFNNIGERNSVKTEYGFDIQLSDDEIPDEAGYEIWKATVMTADSSKGNYHSLPLSGSEAEREVIRRIREFPLESRTMVECAVFLSGLRKILTTMSK